MAKQRPKPASEAAPVREPIITTEVKPAVAFQRSRRKMNLKEFLLGKNLKSGTIAGFKMFLNGKEWMLEEEWEQTLQNYLNR